MAKSCCVPACTANKKSNPGRQFYLIPANKGRREKWLRFINRAVLNPDGSVNKGKLWSPPSNHCYVCSAHFISGKKVNIEPHPDYVPSVFNTQQDNQPKQDGPQTSAKVDRYERRSRRQEKNRQILGSTTGPTVCRRLKMSDAESQPPPATLSGHGLTGGRTSTEAATI